MIKSEKVGTWVIFWDFNIVRRKEERYNSYFSASETFWFSRFIDQAGLYDIRLGGQRYTYLCQVDVKLSKLDRLI